MIELTEDQIGNLLGVLLLACVIGLVAVYVRFDVASVRRTSNKARLREWIQINMPELHAELLPLSMDDIRIRLNEETGLFIQPSDPVEETCALFLQALKSTKECSP